MSSETSAQIKAVPDPEVASPDVSELAQLRDQVALLKANADSRWQEIAALTRMVQTLEAEKIENRSSYDRARRVLEGEVAGLRRMMEKSGGKVPNPKVTQDIVAAADSDWERMYYEIVNSSSWKITRPMRVATRALRRLLRRG